MKIHVDRDAFAEAVAWAARTLPLRPSVPVLRGLLLEVTDEGLVISTFDYEVSSRVVIPVTAAEGGRLLVPGRLLADIVRSLPAQPVDLATDGTRVNINCGSARFTLPTLAAEDYPTLPEMPEIAGTVESDVFASAVTQAAVAAGRDDTWPVLTGVRLEVEGDLVTLAATDRYRLAVRELHWQPSRPDASATVLVPARTLTDVAKTLTSTAEVRIALAVGSAGEGMIGFEAGGRRTTTRLLDGEFPKYRSLIPVESGSVALVDTAAFADAVRRVALVATGHIPLRLSFSTGQVVLEAGVGEDAQAAETLDATYDGEELTIAFNPTFLLDGVGSLDSDVTRMAFTGPTKPAVLTGKDAASEYRYLLMPVRLTG